MAISGSDLSQRYAMCGVAMCGATRNGDTSALVFPVVDGVVRRSVVDGKICTDLSISEQFGQGANTATMRAVQFQPVQGQEIIITLGSINNGDPLYAGRVLRPTVSIPSAKAAANGTIITNIAATDYTFDANERLVTKRYTSMAADAIALDILATFAPQLSSYGIVSGLPQLDEITFTNQTVTGALAQLADRIGGYSQIIYRKHDGKPIAALYLTPDGTNPTPLTNTNTLFQDFKYSADLSKVVTRVFVEGNGSTALAEVPSGATILPVQDTAYFNSFGGIFASGPQRIAYTGLLASAGGSLVGPGALPSAAPALALASGVGIDTGEHLYAVTFVTAAGESLPSPVAPITTSVVADPTDAPTVTTAPYGSSFGGVFVVGGTYHWKYEYLNALGHTLGSAASAAYTPTGFSGGGAYFALVAIPYSTDPNVTQIAIYRTKDGGSTYYRVDDVSPSVVIMNNSSGGTYTFTDNRPDSALVVTDPNTNTTAGNRVAVSGIPIGDPTAVIERNLWRTEADDLQLKFLANIPDNVTTTFADSTADASLGANVPTLDTSGLTQPTGQVNTGSTSLLVAGTGWASASGGWAIIGNGQVIRYTGITGSSLTGIPATGPGAITASITYNSTVTAAPALIGIPASGEGAIVYTINTGDPVNLIAQVDDVSAQATLAALLGGTDDGIREDALQDRRLSFIEATARGTAFLQLRSTAQVSVTYTSRDRNTRVGREIGVDLEGFVGTFKIQTVQITSFVAWGSRANDPLTVDTFPAYAVTASNQRFSLEDLLRQIKGKAA